MARLGVFAVEGAMVGAAALAAPAAPAPETYVVEMTVEADGRPLGVPARLIAHADSAARFALRRDAYAVEAIARAESRDRVYLHLVGTGWSPERLRIESITREIAADGAAHAIAFSSVDPATRRESDYRVEVKVRPEA